MFCGLGCLSFETAEHRGDANSVKSLLVCPDDRDPLDGS